MQLVCRRNAGVCRRQSSGECEGGRGAQTESSEASFEASGVGWQQPDASLLALTRLAERKGEIGDREPVLDAMLAVRAAVQRVLSVRFAESGGVLALALPGYALVYAETHGLKSFFARHAPLSLTLSPGPASRTLLPALHMTLGRPLS